MDFDDDAGFLRLNLSRLFLNNLGKQIEAICEPSVIIRRRVVFAVAVHVALFRVEILRGQIGCISGVAAPTLEFTLQTLAEFEFQVTKKVFGVPRVAVSPNVEFDPADQIGSDVESDWRFGANDPMNRLRQALAMIAWDFKRAPADDFRVAIGQVMSELLNLRTG